MPARAYFPPELWSNVIENFRERTSPSDLMYLWTTIRNVSTQFRGEVEAIFARDHLPKTRLHINSYITSSYCGEHNTIFERYPAQDVIENTHLDCANVFRSLADIVLKFWSLDKNDDHATFIPPPRFRNTEDSWLPQGALQRLVELDKDSRDEREHTANGQRKEENTRLDNTTNAAGISLYREGYPWALVVIRGVIHDIHLSILGLHVTDAVVHLNWKVLFQTFWGAKRVLEHKYGKRPDYDRYYRRCTSFKGHLNSEDKRSAMAKHKQCHLKFELDTWSYAVNNASDSCRDQARWAADSWNDLDASGSPVLQYVEETNQQILARVSSPIAGLKTPTHIPPHCPEIESTNAEEFMTDSDALVGPEDAKKRKSLMLVLPDTASTITLGRSMANVDWHISGSRTVSRAHFRVEYVPELKRIYVQCLGRKAIARSRSGRERALLQGETTTNSREGEPMALEVADVAVLLHCPRDNSLQRGVLLDYDKGQNLVPMFGGKRQRGHFYDINA